MSSDDIHKYNIAVTNSNNYNNLSSESKKKCVVNLDNKNNGTHWTSISKVNPNKNVYIYQDSFGVRPCELGLTNSLIFYNIIKKQKDNETNCGARSIRSLYE